MVPAEGELEPWRYYHPAVGRRRLRRARHAPRVRAQLGAGNVSGLLASAAAFKVPIMNLLMGVPLKATIATSNLMIGVTAAAGAAIFYGRGYMDPYYAVPAALGILAGARLGPRLAMRLSARALGIIFQVVLAVFAVSMLLRRRGSATAAVEPRAEGQDSARTRSRSSSRSSAAIRILLCGIVARRAHGGRPGPRRSHGAGLPRGVVPLAEHPLAAGSRCGRRPTSRWV